MDYDQVLETVAKIKELEEEKENIAKKKQWLTLSRASDNEMMEQDIKRISRKASEMGLEQLLRFSQLSQDLTLKLCDEAAKRASESASLTVRTQELSNEIDKLKTSFY
jgi:GTPase involved in cell partitioning and DNA repair